MDNSAQCTIQMNGEEVTLKFGLPAVKYFLSKIDQGHIPSISGDSINEVGVAYLVYAGYYNHCLIKEVVPEKTFEDFMSWIELVYVIGNESDISQFLKVVQCYDNSLVAKKALENAKRQVDEIKKKMKESIGMKSNLAATASLD